MKDQVKKNKDKVWDHDKTIKDRKFEVFKTLFLLVSDSVDRLSSKILDNVKNLELIKSIGSSGDNSGVLSTI